MTKGVIKKYKNLYNQFHCQWCDKPITKDYLICKGCWEKTYKAPYPGDAK